jgi:hypothetical protein
MQVVGIGGIASSAVGQLWDTEALSHIEMLIINTDLQASTWQFFRGWGPKTLKQCDVDVHFELCHLHTLPRAVLSSQQLGQCPALLTVYCTARSICS